MKVLSTVVMAVAIGATAASLHVAVDVLVGQRNAALAFFYRRSLLQVGGGGWAPGGRPG